MSKRLPDTDRPGVRPQDPESEDSRAVLHSFILRFLRNHPAADVEDLAQQTYVRYYQLKHTDTVRKPRSYFFRIAHNLITEFLLSRQAEKGVITTDSAMVDYSASRVADESVADPEAQAGQHDLINRILVQVPPGYRRILLMNKRDGKTCKQIAAELGRSPRTIEIYLARALNYARKARWK